MNEVRPVDAVMADVIGEFEANVKRLDAIAEG